MENPNDSNFNNVLKLMSVYFINALNGDQTATKKFIELNETFKEVSKAPLIIEPCCYILKGFLYACNSIEWRGLLSIGLIRYVDIIVNLVRVDESNLKSIMSVCYEKKLPKAVVKLRHMLVHQNPPNASWLSLGAKLVLLHAFRTFWLDLYDEKLISENELPKTLPTDHRTVNKLLTELNTYIDQNLVLSKKDLSVIDKLIFDLLNKMSDFDLIAESIIKAIHLEGDSKSNENSDFNISFDKFSIGDGSILNSDKFSSQDIYRILFIRILETNSEGALKLSKSIIKKVFSINNDILISKTFRWFLSFSSANEDFMDSVRRNIQNSSFHKQKLRKLYGMLGSDLMKIYVNSIQGKLYSNYLEKFVRIAILFD